MALIKDIYSYIDSIAAFNTQEEFDNCGLLVGDMDKKVSKAMLALDITDDVVCEAKENGCELIISHHPVIFSPLKRVSSDDIVYKLIKADLSALCIHTNLDKAENIGVNVCLANALKLQNIRLFEDEFLCVGELENTMSDTEFASFVKSSLSCRGVRYTRGNVIKKVAVSSGAGSEAVTLKDKYGFDALVTGELKHHHFLYAKEKSLCAVEAGHFNTENIVIKPLLSALKSKFNDVIFLSCKSLKDPVEFI